jgi:hypothetical protein
MMEYTVMMVRHMISYRTATAVVDAATPEDAARTAAGLSLEWLEDDAIDEGPVDYEVSGPGCTICWRDDAGETRGPLP